MMEASPVHVIGGGLAGSEAAGQISHGPCYSSLLPACSLALAALIRG